ncbi:signal peptidase II [bacterium]|nr:signal peptidase II [bacterium]
MKYLKFFLPALIIIVLDHILKLWVHFNMIQGEEIAIAGSWARLYYVLNPGIAYGIKMNFAFGKLILSLIRILAVGGLGWFIFRLIKRNVHTGLILTLSVIMGGAVGNMIDSVFYGVFLEGNAIYNAPSPWLHGQVIDMLNFPLIESTFPSWFPFWGG